MKNIKKIALLTIIMMLCIFISSGIVNAVAPGFSQVTIDGDSSEPEVTHGANTSTWKNSDNYHWNPCKVSGCTEHTYNYAMHDGSATCVSLAQCSKCGISWGSYAGHTEAINQGNEVYHYVICAIAGCPKSKIENAIRIESHKFDGTNDTHTCITTGCGFISQEAPHHYFSTDRVCEHRSCSAELIFTSGSEITSLPLDTQYYMIGSGVNDWEKNLSFASFTTNLTPYTSRNSDDVMSLDLVIYGFVHGNYAHHAGIYSDMINNSSRPVEMTVWPASNITKPLGQWTSIGEQLQSTGTQRITLNYSNKQYSTGALPDGHWRIDGLYTTGGAVVYRGSATLRLFYNGNGGHLEPTEILAYLQIKYRDMDGNKIIGAPEDARIKVTTWTDHNTGAKLYAEANLDLLDSLGWRYEGYKSGKDWSAPDGLTGSGNLNPNTSITLSTELGDQENYVVFFFEPIKVTVNHINSDRTKINTNKNVEYKLPEILSEAGHTCENLECTHKEITEAGRVPGTTATKHNNTSLNKYLWPGYILTEYKMETVGGKTIKSKTYDLINNYPIENATTRTATAEDDANYGVNNAPQELYQKIVDIPTDIDTGDSVGYREDIVLDFIYTNVDINVSHRDYNTRNIYTDITSGTELAYVQTLNGHYFKVASLILDGNTHTLPETGGQYNMKGYVLREIEITKKNKEIYNKTFEYSQSDTSGLEAGATTTLMYYILSSNDVSSEIINEINRIGSDVEFRFYYEKVPMLTIKHQDEFGNKLWPDEYKILNEELTSADSKNLKKFGYVYKEYYLDDPTLQVPGTQAYQPDANSDIRRVNVPKNGEEDRSLIFVYMQDLPTLLVKYVDTVGNEIAERTMYKMDKETISTSAKDLSGLRDEAENSFEYRDYKLYEGDNELTPITNAGTEVTVTVPKTGNDRLLVFIYERNRNAEIIDSSQIQSESVILKSNYRPDEAGKNGEEYNVLRAIPTSEDLYVNVITDSFLLSNVVSQKNVTQNVHVKLVQPYYKTNNEDNKGTGIAVTDKAYAISSNDYVTIELPYSYFTAENVQLNLISRAVVKNESIEVRDTAGNIKEINQVTLKPNYEKNPELQYKAGGELIFVDLATYYAGMSGKTVEEYIDGTVGGTFNLKSGFYNIKEVNGEKYVEYVLPEVQYTEVKASDMNKIVNEYKENPYLLTRAAEQNDVRVTMDTLKVIRENNAVITILSGAALPINREYTLIQLESMKNSDGTPILDTTPDEVLINNNVLYKKDEIYITETEANQEYKTTADVWYRPHQRVNPTTLQVEIIDNNDTFTQVFTEYELSAEGEILVEAKKDIVGNSVFVHTPVVNGTYISNNSNGIANNQLIDAKNYTEEQKKNILVLGHEFTIRIPNSGTHINETGYGIKDYNYKGLVSAGDTQVNNEFNAFAMERQIKFTFGVIYNNKYYKANEWISLGVSETEEFKFVAPEWEKELWKNTNKHEIETKVIAENATTEARLAMTQKDANTLRDNYVATKTIEVKLIGEMLDLEIRATNDPGYSNYKTEGTTGMPIGQAGQANGGKAYKYGIKLGYSVYFDIASTGWTGDTTEKINLTPKYYYVSKNGGVAQEVDLYYRVVGNPNYVSLNNSPRTLTTIMNADATKGSRCKSRFASLIGTSGFFTANAGVEMSNTARLITLLRNEAEENYIKTSNKNIVNYNVAIQTGTTKLVSLPYTVRLAYANAINAMLNGKYNGMAGLEQVSENAKNYCIGHWYGAFKLPATTVAVAPGITPKPDKSNVKKDGYIIVSFEEIQSESGGTPYLEVGTERFGLDGGDKNFTLPNEKSGSVPNLIPAIIYETDIAMNQDAEIGGSY